MKKLTLIVFLYFSVSQYSNALEANDFEESIIVDSILNVSDGFNYPFGHQLADIDNDGDLDITVADVYSDPRLNSPKGTQMSALYWLQNKGNGEYLKRLIAIDLGFLERHTIADVNGDGNLDIVIGNNRDGGIYWYEGQGRKAQLLGFWERHRISFNGTHMPRVYDVEAADFDKDGNVDIVAASYTGATVVLLKNPGKHNVDRLWTEYVIANKMPYVRTIKIADLDGDGWLDIAVGSIGVPSYVVPLDEENPKSHGSYLRWIRNPGIFPESFWSSIVYNDEYIWRINEIDTSVRAVGHSALADMDGDGDKDIITTFGLINGVIPEQYHHISWYENISNANSWEHHYVAQLDYAFDIAAGDIDKDGDIDLAVTSHERAGQLIILENDNGWSKLILKENLPAVNQVNLGDIDKDGDIDLIVTSDNGNNGNRLDGYQGVRSWKNIR